MRVHLVGQLSFGSCPLRSGSFPASIPVTPLSDLCILGVPLGPPEMVPPFVSQKLLSNLAPLLEKLMAFEDTQAASFLLRISFSAVRATHFMRTNRHHFRLQHSPGF